MEFTSKDFDFSAPFWEGLDDAEQTFDLILGDQSKRFDWPTWNLLCSVRDLTMFCKHGMKPHRHWRLKDVKAYFGISGNKEKILAQLEFLRACALQEQETA
jgi:hypothetical protein